jgi:hypothetical protein
MRLLAPALSLFVLGFFFLFFFSLLPLAIGLGSIVTAVDNEILGAVVELAAEVAGKDSLGTVGVALLGIERGAGHVRDHGVAASEGVLGVAQRVVLGRRLGEPDVTAVAGKMAGLEGLGDVLLDNDGATGGVDEVRTLLHLGDELLVEKTLGLLVERAVDGDNVALGEHLLEGVDTSAANLLLDLSGQRLVVVIEELLAVEGLETAENTLADTADGDSADDLALEVVLLLGGGRDVPLATLNHLVGGDEVADEEEDSHDDVLSDGNDVRAGDLGDGDTAIGGVGGVEVDVIGADTSSDGELEVLGLGQALSSEVTGVEGGGDDDLGVDKLLVELGVLTLLVGGGDEGVALILEPFADAEFVLCSSEELRDLRVMSAFLSSQTLMYEVHVRGVVRGVVSLGAAW